MQNVRPNDSGFQQSSWMEVAMPSWPDDLGKETTVDVCVIGAGMAGLSTAFALVEQGRSVLVVDDGPAGGGETARTSAHLASALDDRFERLERLFGEHGARDAFASHAAAIDAIEERVRRLGIECGFRRVDGWLFLPENGSRDELDREFAAAQRAGTGVVREARAPLPWDTGPCLRFPDQAEFHPIAYLRGLALAIDQRGGRIRNGVHATDVRAGEEGRDDGRVVVHLAGERRVLARAVVDATNATITSSVRMPVRQYPYRTYAVGLQLPTGVVPPGLYWDTADPYHYVRLAPAPAGDAARGTAPGAAGGTMLLVGGEDHKTGQEERPAERWTRLVQWARARVPQAGDVVAKWSGQVLEPADALAFIGRSPELENVYVVTGDSGHGLTHGTIASLLLPELIAGRGHAWANLYDPKRSWQGVGTLVKENVNVAAQYADWVKPGDVRSFDALRNGEGAVVRQGLHLVAAYRDGRGECWLRSARCPHLGAVVAWNPAEKSWDCPAHGSRFDPHGRVINGPACADLPPPPEQGGEEPCATEAT